MWDFFAKVPMCDSADPQANALQTPVIAVTAKVRTISSIPIPEVLEVQALMPWRQCAVRDWEFRGDIEYAGQTLFYTCSLRTSFACAQLRCRGCDR